MSRVNFQDYLKQSKIDAKIKNWPGKSFGTGS